MSISTSASAVWITNRLHDSPIVFAHLLKNKERRVKREDQKVVAIFEFEPY
jgi:hypothetical protein